MGWIRNFPKQSLLPDHLRFLILGLSLNYIGITPIQGLIYSAVLYGLTAPVLIGIILHIGNNKKSWGIHQWKAVEPARLYCPDIL